MANEGYLGKTSLSGERAATDDHPLILHALPLADSVTYPLPVGTLMKRVEVKTGAAVTSYVYADWDGTDGSIPCAVVDIPCDPTGTSAEKSAKCIVHGTVKTHLLKVGAVAKKQADPVAIEKLRQSGIFAV